MRTKTLLCAAILAAGVASSMAQSNVYSLNVVGYYNVVCNAGVRTLLGNQLNTTNNTLTSIIPGPMPDGTSFFHFAGSYQGSDWDTDANAWTANYSLAPGEGGFLFVPTQTTVTFVGEVMQGTTTNKFNKNVRNLRCLVTPQAMTLTQMALPAEDGDSVFQFHGSYAGSDWDTDAGAWTSDQNYNVGEAFFYFKSSGNNTNWIRTFTVQ